MSELLNRFSFQATKFNGQVAAACVFLWALVVWCTIASIYSQPFTPRQRQFWLATVILLPGFGLLAYLPFSFRREDLPHAFLLKPKDSRKKPVSRGGLRQGGMSV